MTKIRAIILLVVYCSLVNGDCKFHNDDVEDKGLQSQIRGWKAIYSKNFTVSKNNSTYKIGICSDVTTGNISGAILQEENKETIVIGRLDSVNLVGGSGWILMTYEKGDQYINICDNATRTASIVFVCGPNVTNITVRQQHTSTDKHCNYIFQLEVPELCPKVQTPTEKMSGGAIFLIVVLSLASVYLIGGFLFMRFQRGARGIDQIPQLEMWRKLGHLAADGCDFCCRCSSGTQRAGYFLDESGPDIRGDDDILAP